MITEHRKQYMREYMRIHYRMSKGMTREEAIADLEAWERKKLKRNRTDISKELWLLKFQEEIATYDRHRAIRKLMKKFGWARNVASRQYNRMMREE